MVDTAKQLIEAAEQKAQEIGVPSVITVTNQEGNLVAQHRMENAWLPSMSISRQKAYTAAGLKILTQDLANPSQPGELLYGVQDTDQGRLVIFGGGYPLEKDGEVVGAIAASGGQVKQDLHKWDEIDIGESTVTVHNDIGGHCHVARGPR